jgi:hypothetical protein
VAVVNFLNRKSRRHRSRALKNRNRSLKPPIRYNQSGTEDKTATTKIGPRSSALKTGKTFATTEKFDGLSAALVDAVTAKNGNQAIQHFVSFIPKLTAILTAKQ